MSKKILSFGEVLWDLLPSDTVLGGAPLNFAYRADSLGDVGLMVSRLGRDELGTQAFEKMVELGLDTTYMQWDKQYPTGTVQVSFDRQNNPDYVIIPHVAYDHIELTEALIEIAAQVDCLCFGTLAQRSGQSRRTLSQLIDASNRSLKLLDINLRKDCHRPQTIEFSLDKADILKLNEDEAHQLGRMLGIPYDGLTDICQAILERKSLGHCVVTLAAKGALAVSASGEAVYVPGYEIDLVDSLGSGDAFSAGFIHEILHGNSLREACEFGNVLGALVATQQAATVPITQEQIEQFRSRDWQRNVHSDLAESLTD
jgi:fructokinase